MSGIKNLNLIPMQILWDSKKKTSIQLAIQ